MAARNAGDAGGSGTGGPGIGKPKSESGVIGDSEGDVEERRLGLEGRALDEMKWVYFYLYAEYGAYVGWTELWLVVGS